MLNLVFMDLSRHLSSVFEELGEITEECEESKLSLSTGSAAPIVNLGLGTTALLSGNFSRNVPHL